MPPWFSLPERITVLSWGGIPDPQLRLLKVYQKQVFLIQRPKLAVLGMGHRVTKPPHFYAGSKPMIYGYLRTSRAAVDGLSGMHSDTKLQALADAGVKPDNIYQDVGISGSVLVSYRPGLDRA